MASVIIPSWAAWLLTCQVLRETVAEQRVEEGGQVPVNKEREDDADEDVDRGYGDEDGQQVHYLLSHRLSLTKTMERLLCTDMENTCSSC